MHTLDVPSATKLLPRNYLTLKSLPLDSLIVFNGLVKLVIFWRNYKIESQNKKLIFSNRFMKTLKVTLFYGPDWLELSREGDKRLHNQVVFFPLREVYSTPYTTTPIPHRGI